MTALSPFSAASDNDALALYVHWPFCLHKCPYCDFNSHVRDRVEERHWRDALLREMEAAGEILGRRPLASIFFGGGTPSLMAGETVAALTHHAVSVFSATDDIEITLEANPTSAEAGRFHAYRAGGVNRLSLGIQSLRDDALRFLGRRHSAGEARRALALAREIFPRFSFDLIYARPGDTVSSWRRELDEVLSLAGDHVSLYQLTLEENTPFFEAGRRGEIVLPGEDDQAMLYDATVRCLAEAGLDAYEVSNFARPGASSRHNLAYWRYGDYLGIGPGAHSRIRFDGTRRATTRFRRPETWLNAVSRRGHGIESDVVLTPGEQIEEALLMGLRLDEGVPLARLEAIAGAPLPAPAALARTGRLIGAGFLRAGDPRRLRATGRGRLRLNAVIAEIAADLDDFLEAV